jgi:hypothetical protein
VNDHQYAALLARLGELERKIDNLTALVKAAPPAKGKDGAKLPLKKIDGKWHAFHEGTGWVRTWVRDKFPPKDGEG